MTSRSLPLFKPIIQEMGHIPWEPLKVPGPVLQLLREGPSQALHLVLAFPPVNKHTRPRPGFLGGEARITSFAAG